METNHLLPAKPDALTEAVQHCKKVIQKGSLSFSLVSKLFGIETKQAAHSLYGWCRYCDDKVDRLENGQNPNVEEKLIRVRELRAQTKSAYNGEKQSDPVFIAFQAVTKNYQIPEIYPQDLLDGMEMDARGTHYETVQDLELYCYRVAGVVGLMMSHIMGLKGSNQVRALNHAVHMGNAMQLTNIARDVLEDAKMGRVYLPRHWLNQEGLQGTPEEIIDEKNRKVVARVTHRLLRVADFHYEAGNKGLVFLPFRAAMAVAAASEVYRTIGRLVRMRGSEAWDTRTIVPLWLKILVVGRGIVSVLCRSLWTLPQVKRSDRSINPIKSIWRPL